MNGRTWRVGEHYGIHVYEGDRPVATFHETKEAALAVEAVNGMSDRLAYRRGAGDEATRVADALLESGFQNLRSRRVESWLRNRANAWRRRRG